MFVWKIWTSSTNVENVHLHGRCTWAYMVLVAYHKTILVGGNVVPVAHNIDSTIQRSQVHLLNYDHFQQIGMGYLMVTRLRRWIGMDNLPMQTCWVLYIGTTLVDNIVFYCKASNRIKLLFICTSQALSTWGLGKTLYSGWPPYNTPWHQNKTIRFCE